jgi:hypothetical protein
VPRWRRFPANRDAGNCAQTGSPDAGLTARPTIFCTWRRLSARYRMRCSSTLFAMAAMSHFPMSKQGWSHPLPWDRNERLGVAGLYWEWAVRKGRSRATPRADYQEVRFEELIANPQETLSRLGLFIDHDLDYDRIQRAGIGSVSQPNSSFAGESKGFQSRGAVEDKDVSWADTLFEGTDWRFSARQLGYSLFRKVTGKESSRGATAPTYLAMFEAKHRMKATPLGQVCAPSRTSRLNRRLPPETRKILSLSSLKKLAVIVLESNSAYWRNGTCSMLIGPMHSQ